MVKKFICVFIFISLLISITGCKNRQNKNVKFYINKLLIGAFNNDVIYVLNPKNNRFLTEVPVGENPASFIYKNNKLFVLNAGRGTSGTIGHSSITIFTGKQTISKPVKASIESKLASNYNSKYIYCYDEINNYIYFYIDSQNGNITYLNKNLRFIDFIKIRKKLYIAATSDNVIKGKSIKLFNARNFTKYKTININSEKSETGVYIKQFSKNKTIIGINNNNYIFNLNNFSKKITIFPYAQSQNTVLYKNNLYTFYNDKIFILTPEEKIVTIKGNIKGNIDIVSISHGKAILIERKDGNEGPIAKKIILYNIKNNKILNYFNTNVEYEDIETIDNKVYLLNIKNIGINIFDFTNDTSKFIKTKDYPSSLKYIY